MYESLGKLLTALERRRYIAVSRNDPHFMFTKKRRYIKTKRCGLNQCVSTSVLKLWMIFFFFIVFAYIFQMFFAVSLYFSHQKSSSNKCYLNKEKGQMNLVFFWTSTPRVRNEAFVLFFRFSIIK